MSVRQTQQVNLPLCGALVVLSSQSANLPEEHLESYTVSWKGLSLSGTDLWRQAEKHKEALLGSG